MYLTKTLAYAPLALLSGSYIANAAPAGLLNDRASDATPSIAGARHGVVVPDAIPSAATLTRPTGQIRTSDVPAAGGEGTGTVGGIANDVLASVDGAGEAPYTFVKAFIGRLAKQYPDQNIFVYRKYHEINWWVEDWSKMSHVDVTWPGTRSWPAEYYGVVVFSGRGALDKNHNDNTWVTWAWHRGTRNGEIVDFY